MAHLGRALVLSRLDYCNSLFLGTSKGNLHDLQVIQNNAVRAVKPLGRREHVSQHRRDLHWLPVKSRIEHKVLSLVFKCRSGVAPPYLTQRLVPATAARALRNGPEHKFVQPRCRLQTFDATTFDVSAPRLWNALPLEIRAIPSLSSFKRSVNTRLFA